MGIKIKGRSKSNRYIYYVTWMVMLLLYAGCSTFQPSPINVSIRSGDIATVKSLLETGEDVNGLNIAHREVVTKIRTVH